ncbi:MAG: hypothetical protein ACREO5_15135, partial [Candidatus Binatia bacterium]
CWVWAVRTSVPDGERSRGHSSHTGEVVVTVALVIDKNLSKCKSRNWREIVWSATKKISKNHRLRLILAQRKIALDNSLADTYHTRACPKGLTSNARKADRGNRVNRGADVHDE